MLVSHGRSYRAVPRAKPRARARRVEWKRGERSIVRASLRQLGHNERWVEAHRSVSLAKHRELARRRGCAQRDARGTGRRSNGAGSARHPTSASGSRQGSAALTRRRAGPRQEARAPPSCGAAWNAYGAGGGKSGSGRLEWRIGWRKPGRQPGCPRMPAAAHGRDAPICSAGGSHVGTAGIIDGRGLFRALFGCVEIAHFRHRHGCRERHRRRRGLPATDLKQDGQHDHPQAEYQARHAQNYLTHVDRLVQHSLTSFVSDRLRPRAGSRARSLNARTVGARVCAARANAGAGWDSIARDS